MTEQSAPADVTMRELTELVRTFTESGWASLDVEVHGMHLVLGRDGPPTGSGTVTAGATAAPPVAAITPSAPVMSAVSPAAPVGVASVVPAAAEAPAPTPATPQRSAEAIEVRSKAIGSFWVAPSPGESAFTQVGATVVAGQQLAIVEVMKLMSDVAAPCAGTVLEICAKNADLVEFDQVLFVIEPSEQ